MKRKIETGCLSQIEPRSMPGGRLLENQAEELARQNLRGKVWQVKRGYNPNSSSIGSEIPLFLAMAVSAGTLTVLALHLLGSVERLIRRHRAGNQGDGENNRGDHE
ncbi:MAG: hypothetical protein JSU72_19275 [Deltaproteobacteria bacterium]|nr:MAG: hypothetical protein JSU72_19275 [Deltaproteobacteria bacterium]